MNGKSIFILFIMAVAFLSYADNPQQEVNLITIGCESDYPPYCMVNEAGEASGFSVDLINAAAAAVHLDTKYETGLWSKVKDDLAEGRIDALPMVGRTPEREDLFDFTFPYISLHGAIFVRKGNNPINSISDLKDKKLMVMKDDNAEEFARRTQISYNIITTVTFQEAFQMLAAGKADAVLTQRVMGLQLLNEMGIDSIEPLSLSLNEFRQDFCFAVKEGDKQLLEKLNEGLAIIISDGTFDKIHQKWYSPLVNHNISLKEAFTTAAYIIIPVLLIYALILLVLMRKEVKRKTSALRKEVRKYEKTLEKLEIEEAKFHSYIDSAPTGVFVVDEKGKYLEVNNAAERMTGYTKEELLKMNVIDLYEQEFKQIAKTQLQDIAQSGKMSVEIPFLTKTGEKRYWQLEAVKLSSNRFLGFTTDTTEKYLTKDKLQNNKDQLQFLFDNMNSAFAYHKIVLDENGKPVDYIFMEINHRFENMLGLKKVDIIGKKVTEVLPGTENDPADWIGKYGEVALTGKSFKFENYSQEIGKWFIVSAYSPMKGYFATVFDDITVRKENEKKLQKYSDNLEMRVQERTLELEKMNTELIHFNKLFVGREFRIKELRDKIKSMDEKLQKYES